jgi:hypothetical protein
VNEEEQKARAMEQAHTTLQNYPHTSWLFAKLLCGKLRCVGHKDLLVTLKKELASFNEKTLEWEDGQ